MRKEIIEIIKYWSIHYLNAFKNIENKELKEKFDNYDFGVDVYATITKSEIFIIEEEVKEIDEYLELIAEIIKS
jgi:hypothetical protein